MDMRPLWQILLMALLLTGVGMLTSCASITKGITEGFYASSVPKEDRRICYIRGRAIEGIQVAFDKQEPATRRVLKVLMVHGIGSHKPGYGTRMAENLARSFDLNRVQEHYKEFSLSYPDFSEKELGVLRFSRYLNAAETREMIFAELTWDTIIEQEKQGIAFDKTGEYSFRRTPLNNILKEYVNDTLPDVLMFNGSSRPLIQLSIGQALCWIMTPSWESLPKGGVQFCNRSDPQHLEQFDDEYVFISHSLGSRITVDALQWMAEMATEAAKSDPALQTKVRRLQDKRFTVFMLANQLPLLQLGQQPPLVRGRIDEICGPGAQRSGERFFGETHLVAFSDPNDLLSYAIPPGFLDNYLDSRICPTLTNVILGVARVADLFGAEFANPILAHTEYDNDSRVIGLMTKGIGSVAVDPEIARHCTWLETVPEKR